MNYLISKLHPIPVSNKVQGWTVGQLTKAEVTCYSREQTHQDLSASCLNHHIMGSQVVMVLYHQQRQCAQLQTVQHYMAKVHAANSECLFSSVWAL